jgi:hypothetical protein
LLCKIAGDGPCSTSDLQDAAVRRKIEHSHCRTTKRIKVIPYPEIEGFAEQLRRERGEIPNF